MTGSTRTGRGWLTGHTGPTLVVAMAVAVGLSGCSGSGKDSNQAASSSGSAAPLVPVRMGEDPGLAALGIYVAHDEGIFEKNGLDVTVTATTDITQLPAAVGQQYDFAVGVQPITIAAAAHGLPIVVSAGGQVESDKAPNSQLIVKKDAGITSASDLAGKKVGVATVNGNLALCVRAWMKAHGQDPKSVQLMQVAFPNEADALKAGLVDAIDPIVPFDHQALAAGNVSLGDPCLAINPKSQGSFQISNAGWAKSHLDVVRKVQKSLEEANTWIQANPDKAKAVLSKWTSQPASATADLSLPEYNGQESVQDMKDWIDVVKEFGTLPGSLPDATSLVLDAGN